MKHKSILALSVVALLLFPLGGQTSYANSNNPVDATKRQLVLAEELNPDGALTARRQYLMFSVYGQGAPISNPSRVWGWNGGVTNILCESLNSECINSAERFSGLGYFNFCETVDVAPCVEKLEYSIDGAEFLEADFMREVDFTPSQSRIDQVVEQYEKYDPFGGEILDVGAKVGWEAVPKYGLPGSAKGPLLFSAPEAVNGGGATTYGVTGRFEFDVNKVQGKPVISYSKFDLNVRPYLETKEPTAQVPVEVIRKDKWGNIGASGSGTGGNEDWVWQEEGRIGYATSYPENIKFKILLKLPNELGGWYQGRLEEAGIEVTPIDANTSHVSIQGGYVSTAVTSAYGPKFDPEFMPMLDWLHQGEGILSQDREREAAGQGGLIGTSWNAGDPITDLYALWAPYFPEKAKGEYEIWYVGTLPKWETGRSPCLTSKGKFMGLITTDAMVYQPGLPSFVDGYLGYKVSGVHYDYLGKVELGSYELIMRSEAARCLYGFSQAPVFASVSVVGINGEENVATTVVAEKDGWLKLAAYGFTFSDKEIQVKISQPLSFTMTKFVGTTRTLSSSQKSEIRATVTKAKGNPKFICTGTYVNASSKATALARARAVCNYAKSLDKNHSYYAQAKQTKAKSYDNKVMITSK